MPPLPGAEVRRATGEERAQALYFDKMDRKVPVGKGRDGAPIYLNLEFLDGTRGGHVSISGISGVATKTSFALFLLYSIFQSGVLGKRSVNAKALVFSVKGEDLLFLDHTNTRLDGNLIADYAELGLPAGAFASAGFYAPPTPDDPSGRPFVTGRTSGVTAFWWTLAEFCAGELLPYVFADAEDERNQYTMVIHTVAARLRREATAGRRRRGVDRGPDPAHVRRAGRVRLRTARRRRGPPRLGGPGHRHRHGQRVPAATALVAQAAARHRARRPPGHPGAAGDHRGQAGHGRRPAQPPRARPALRGGRRARGRDGAQGGGGRERAAVHDDRRAEQVRAARGVEPDQGGAARHRRARPFAGHHPHRRAADGVRGGAPDRGQLVGQGGRQAGPGRGGASGVRVPACVAAHPRHAGQAGHDVRLAAGDPRAAGRRVPVPGVGHAAVGVGRRGARRRTGRPRATRSPGSATATEDDDAPF